MADKITALVFDGLTGEVTERELSSEELAEREAEHLASEAKKEAESATKASALAKLAALGLTEEEIAAL
jgi:hypothetical protein